MRIESYAEDLDPQLYVDQWLSSTLGHKNHIRSYNKDDLNKDISEPVPAHEIINTCENDQLQVPHHSSDSKTLPLQLANIVDDSGCQSPIPMPEVTKEDRQTVLTRNYGPDAGVGLDDCWSSRDWINMNSIGRKSPINKQSALSGAGGDENKVPYACEADPPENYRKHKRRKTKPDKYEYKGNGEHHHPFQQPATQKLASTRFAQRKDFQAPNVQAKRVSLPQGSHSGIFGNAKFSSSFEGRDLPDLTFCEMSFLSATPKLEPSASGTPSDRSGKVRKQGGNLQPKVSDYVLKGSNYENMSQSTQKAVSLDPDAHMGLPQATSENSTGLEARNPNFDSQVALPNNSQQRQQPLDSEGVDTAHLDAQRRPMSRSAQDEPSSTSYVSWSVSPPRRETYDDALSMSQPYCERSEVVSDGRTQLPRNNLVALGHDSFLHNDSPDNDYLADHVRSILLPGHGHRTRNYTEKSKVSKKYSLQQLKELAGVPVVESSSQPTNGGMFEMYSPTAETTVTQNVQIVGTTAPLKVDQDSNASGRITSARKELLTDFCVAEAEHRLLSPLNRSESTCRSILDVFGMQQKSSGHFLPSTSNTLENNKTQRIQGSVYRPGSSPLSLPEFRCRDSVRNARRQASIPEDSSQMAPKGTGVEHVLDPISFDGFDMDLILDRSWRSDYAATRGKDRNASTKNVTVVNSMTKPSLDRVGICEGVLGIHRRERYRLKVWGKDNEDEETNENFGKRPALLRPSLEEWSHVELFAPFGKPNKLSR